MALLTFGVMTLIIERCRSVFPHVNNGLLYSLRKPCILKIKPILGTYTCLFFSSFFSYIFYMNKGAIPSSLIIQLLFFYEEIQNIKERILGTMMHQGFQGNKPLTKKQLLSLGEYVGTIPGFITEKNWIFGIIHCTGSRPKKNLTLSGHVR